MPVPESCWMSGGTSVNEPHSLPWRRANQTGMKQRSGLPGKFCTSGAETNWYGRSKEWAEQRSIVRNRS